MRTRLGILCALSVGCAHQYAVPDLSRAELGYPITKDEPPGCAVMREFDGRRSPCGNAEGHTEAQVGCFRRAITDGGGNYGVIDNTDSSGWYKGRVLACSEESRN
jgi:hypothetical protein